MVPGLDLEKYASHEMSNFANRKLVDYLGKSKGASIQVFVEAAIFNEFCLDPGTVNHQNNQFAIKETTPTLGEPRQVLDAPRIWLRQVGKLAARIDGFA